MLTRHIEPFLATLLRHFPCVAVTGVRQCGKTTLLGALPGEWRRFDMESVADRQQVLVDPDLFLRIHADKVAIDEAQLAPALFPALRVAIDRERDSKGRFVLSGSSSPDLVKAMAETLAGRIGLAELGPLTLAEAWQLPPSSLYGLLANRAAPADIVVAAAPRLSLGQILEYWFQGGYPEPWLSGDAEFRRLWHRNYLDTYLLRDVAALFPNLNRDRYRQLIQMLSHLSGSILNNAEIARSLGVSEPTVRDWLEIAHRTYLWRHVPAWDRSPHKQLVRHPKGYLRDSGMLHRLLQVPDADALATHPLNGRSWEGLVVETLLRGFENAGLRMRPFHYRTRGGAEIDLILEGEAGLIPVEIKLGSHADARALGALRDFVATQDCPIGLVINNDEKPRQLDERIVALPAASL
ncbi:MAG: ATP-binding protein [Rhodocyclaceae bacterium]|nr:ATP-binding protein [Rhodocyclaceae bacterium]